MTTWTEAYLGDPFTGNFTSIAFDNGNNAIATTSNMLVRSTDGGVTWGQIASPGNASPTFVFHNGANFIDITSGNAVYTSPDGVTWTQATGVTGSPNGFLFNNTSKTLILTETATGTNVNLFRMPNTATNFTQTVTNAVGPNEGSLGGRTGYFSNGGAWIAPHHVTSPSIQDILYKSTDDGVTWTAVLTLPTGDEVFQVEYNGLVYCLFAQQTSNDNNLQYSSPDGTTWTVRNNVASATAPFVLLSAVFNNIFFSVNQDNHLSHSTDAISWSTTTLSVLTDIVDLWVHGGKLYAAGSGGISSSPDGTTWTNELNTNSDFDCIRGNTVPDNIAGGATDLSNSFGAALWTPVHSSGGTNATLVWDASTVGTYALANYEVFRGVNEGSQSLLKTVGPTVLTTDDNTLSPGNSYTYGLKAIDVQGNLSPESNTITVSSGSTNPMFLTAGSPQGGVEGFTDGVFASFGFAAAGDLSPIKVNGTDVGALYWAFASGGNSSVTLGLYSAAPAWTYITYTDAFGILRTYLKSQATLSHPTGAQSQYRWSIQQPQAFNISATYAITWSAGAETDFAMTPGVVSTGPFSSGPISGDGNGFFQPVTLGGGSTGSMSPGGTTPSLNGNQLYAVCCTGSPGATRVICVVVAGTVAKTFFNALSYVSTVSTRIETFSTGAAHFDTTSYPGFSVWTWPVITNYPFGFSSTPAVTTRFV